MPGLMVSSRNMYKAIHVYFAQALRNLGINRDRLVSHYDLVNLMQIQIVAVQIVAWEIGRRPTERFGLEVQNIRPDL